MNNINTQLLTDLLPRDWCEPHSIRYSPVTVYLGDTGRYPAVIEDIYSTTIAPDGTINRQYHVSYDRYGSGGIARIIDRGDTIVIQEYDTDRRHYYDVCQLSSDQYRNSVSRANNQIESLMLAKAFSDRYESERKRKLNQTM